MNVLPGSLLSGFHVETTSLVEALVTRCADLCKLTFQAGI